MKYNRTLWINPSGEVLNITGTKRTHHDWAKRNTDLFTHQSTSVFEMVSSSKWVKISNDINIEIEGMSDSLRNNAGLLKDIIDDRLFSERIGPFWVNIQELDETGSVNNRKCFRMPEDDSKLRRYL